MGFNSAFKGLNALLRQAAEFTDQIFHLHKCKFV